MQNVTIIDLKLCQCWNKQWIHLNVLGKNGKIGNIIHTICGAESQLKWREIRDNNVIWGIRMQMNGGRESDGHHIVIMDVVMEMQTMDEICSTILSRKND